MIKQDFASKIFLQKMTVKIFNHLETVRKYNHKYLPQRLKDLFLMK